MKHIKTTLICGLLGLGITACAATQTFTYSDDFTTNTGALNNRTTVDGFGSWVVVPGAGGGAVNDVVVTAGAIGTNNNTNSYNAYFAMPTLVGNEIINVNITMRSWGTNGQLRFGFLEDAATQSSLFQAGTLLTMQQTGSQSTVWAGPGRTTNILPEWTSVAANNTTLTYSLTYNLSTKLLDYTITWSSGERIVASSQLIDLDADMFSSFGISLINQTPTTGADGLSKIAALSVSVTQIPEASTQALMMGACIFAVAAWAIRRRNR